MKSRNAFETQQLKTKIASFSVALAVTLVSGTASADLFDPPELKPENWLTFGEPAIFTEDEINNDVAYAKILASTAAHNPAFVTSLLGTPPASVIAEFVAFSANIAQKKLPARFTDPADRDLSPNYQNGCVLRFDLPQSQFPFSDLFGFLPISAVTEGGNFFYGVPTDWGELGTPTVFHQNSEVIVTARHPLIPPDGDGQTIYMPAGRHTITWTADTLIDPVFDVAIPAALLGTSVVAWAKAPQQTAALAGDAAKATKELSKSQKLLQFVAGLDNLTKFKAGLKPVTIVADKYDWVAPTERVGVTHMRTQQFNVYDDFDPELTVEQPVLEIEATDFGGVFRERALDQILDTITAVDPCDGELLGGNDRPVPGSVISRPVNLTHDIPRLLRIGPTEIEWTAIDAGPNRSGGKNSVTRAQTIVVTDTQAPIMVTPPGKVIEVDLADDDATDGTDRTGVDPAIVDLGRPRVVDLADPSPSVASDAPLFFPVNTRTAVTWTATDSGFPTPNSTIGTQLITVKELGANTAPVVSDRSAATLTSLPIDIVLSGEDFDMLDGRVDPLGFEIVERPGNGEFIAPLFPFFIEDYRTNPEGPFGEEFFLSGNRNNWLYDNFCRQNRVIPIDWVYQPRFVQVTDDGTLFMLDTYWKCNPSDATGGGPRISKWDAEGNFLGQIDYGGTNDAFVLDQDGSIYTNSLNGAGSSRSLFVSQQSPDFDTNSNFRGDSWRFTYASTPGDFVDNRNYSYARVDSRQGVIYVNDRRRIFAFDIRADLADPERNSNNGMDDRYLGALKDAEEVFACTSSSTSWTGFAMDVDSNGFLYAIDSCGHRIHKFEPSYFDDDGEFVRGAYVGWMGRCETSTNKACDEELGVTKGFSCTDETCTVSSSNRRGAEQGQFSSPQYISIDPNDVLYIADTGNLRVQRFAPDGTFAGEAVSTGTGINQGDSPSFVLGNMGAPKAVSVNSTQFYVVDQDESFVNVFETSPFKDITDSSVTVEYVSEFSFHSGVDRFSYRATDGLAESNIGTVSVQVNRNFRAPEAFAIEASTDEDTAVVVALSGDDPDGILGVDFNGLDELTFSVVEQPRHGTLTGSGENRTYSPDADFFGEDRFTYIANDGVLNSPPAVATIIVEPVDDAPQVMALDLPLRVGRGFPVALRGGYRDDGAELHEAFVRWGDGSSDSTGDFVDPDGEGGEPPFLDGVKVLEPVNRIGAGAALASHVYATAGLKSIEFCMGDEQERQTCTSQFIEVENAVGLSVDIQAAPPEILDGRSDITITVTNMLPEGGGGMVANEVMLQQQPNSLYRVLDIVGSAPGCELVTETLACSLGDMPAGDSYSVSLRVERTAPLIYQEDAFIQAVATTSSTAIQNVTRGYIAMRILVDSTDSDGDGMSDVYEDTYGLDTTSASDANGDIDGDTLTNLQEFWNRSNPLNRDSDSDGLGDAEEVARGLEPSRRDSDGDGMDDGWELQFGLDPLSDVDGTLDPDGDGLTNREEFDAGTDISNPDSDGDGVNDGEDLFATDARDSVDSDGDGVGDNADAFPDDATEQFDTDADGIGDNADTDDDNDGLLDGEDDYPLGRFVDARPTNWAFQFIERLARAGVTRGCGGDNYCPENAVTRAQMAVFLERALRGGDYRPPAPVGNVFLDVGATDFAAGFIEQLFADGITGGCGRNRFCPDDSVSRAQMAVFVLRALYGQGYSPQPPTGVFNDVDLSYWAVSWIEALAAEGITAGCGNGNFCPDAEVTRAQMAVFLVRAFDLGRVD